MLITITNKIMTATIDSKGAELKSLCNKEGKQFIWDGSQFWSRSAPFLFPVVGGQRNDVMIFDGKEYPIKQHGFARDMQWEVSEQTGDKVTFCLKYNEDTLKVYPFEFLLTVTYTLVESYIKIDIKVSNMGDKKMLYCFGTHPAIRCPFTENTVFEDYYLEFNKEENISQVILNENREVDIDNRKQFMSDDKTLPLDYDVFVKNDAVIYDKINSDAVRIKNRKNNSYVEVRFKNFTQFGVWSPCKDAPFVCIEPWNGCATVTSEDGTFEDKLGARSLDCNESHSFTMEIDTENT